jgi:hypothetical protein
MGCQPYSPARYVSGDPFRLLFRSQDQVGKPSTGYALWNGGVRRLRRRPGCPFVRGPTGNDGDVVASLARQGVMASEPGAYSACGPESSPLACTIDSLGIITLFPQCNVLVDSLTFNEIIFNRGNCQSRAERMVIEEQSKFHPGGVGVFNIGDSLVLEGKANIISSWYPKSHAI